MGSLAHDESEILLVIELLFGGLMFFSPSAFVTFQKKKYVTALRQWMKQSCF